MTEEIEAQRLRRNARRRAWERANRERVNASKRKTYGKDIEASRGKQRERYSRKPAEQLAKTADGIRQFRAQPKIKAREAMRQREYRKQHPEHVRARATRQYHSDPTRKLIMLARQRANKRGQDFGIDESDVVIPATCPVLGLPIVFGPGIPLHDNTPTIDRIRNEQGYVKGNVIVVSWRANRLKSNSTPKELRAIAQFYEALEQ